MSKRENQCPHIEGQRGHDADQSHAGKPVSGSALRRCHLGIWCLAVLLAVSVPGAALPPAPTSCATGMLNQQQTRAALDAITQHIRSAHYGSLDGIPPTLATALDKLRREAPMTMPAWKFALAVNQALATANDGHLALHLKADVEAHCRQLPLALNWGDSGLLVRSGATVPTGARVLSIGGKSLLALQQEAVATIPHENVYWARAELARQLPRQRSRPRRHP